MAARAGPVNALHHSTWTRPEGRDEGRPCGKPAGSAMRRPRCPRQDGHSARPSRPQPPQRGGRSRSSNACIQSAVCQAVLIGRLSALPGRDRLRRVKLIVTIPAYNEEETLGAAIREIPRAVRGITDVEVLVCDDGSDRKSTRLNSSHLVISYAVFCLKK